MTDEPDQIVLVEVVIAAPRDEVWEALRDPAQIRRWHGWDGPGLDDEIRFIYQDDAEASPAEGTIDFPGVSARFTVEAQGDDRTVLRVTKAAPAGGGTWEDVYEDVDQGWITFIHQLRFALERHPGQERRALYVEGRPGEGGSVIDALGFAAAATSPAGARCSVTTPWGDQLDGEVAFRSRYQLGMTVDSYGDGLVVIHDLPALAPAPAGQPTGGAGPRGKAIVTTYGLDAAALAAVREPWEKWFAG